MEAEGIVLVVDDEHSVRTVTSRALTLFGFQVLTAHDGETGLALFREHVDSIRCVLVDLNMPGLKGEAVVASIQDYRPGTVVVVMTGYNEADARERLSGCGATSVLPKPFTIDTLQAAIASAIGS